VKITLHYHVPIVLPGRLCPEVHTDLGSGGPVEVLVQLRASLTDQGDVATMTDLDATLRARQPIKVDVTIEKTDKRWTLNQAVLAGFTAGHDPKVHNVGLFEFWLVAETCTVEEVTCPSG